MYETRPTPVMSGMRQSCSGMYPIRSRTGTPSPMSRPRTFAVPAVGCNRLRRSRKNVVFPAPFGPTSPIAPSGIWIVRSSTARTSPKTFVSPAVSTSTFIPSFLVAFRGGGNPGEPRQGLVELVCGERARVDRDVLEGEDVAMPRGGEVRLVLRAHRPAEGAERRVQLHMAGEIRRRVLADIQIERWDGRHRCRRIDPEVRHELRRDDERHVGVIR